MDELRALFESLGHEDIETYIQSGNVLFESAQTGEVTLRVEIHEAIKDEFGYDIPVIIRTWAELTDIVAGQPFDVPGEDGIDHYVTFLSEEPTEEQIETLLDDE